tara:strand:- start:1003 stop:1899 length:897 start_codon:yes stop_codon:yes gene_type:complete
MSNENYELNKNKDKIHRSKQYARFILIKGNRAIDQNQVMQLTNQMKKDGVMNIPINVKEVLNDGLDDNTYGVIKTDKKGNPYPSLYLVCEGQHRKSAYETLKLPIPFTFEEKFDLEKIHNLNMSQRSWDSKDILHSGASIGMKTYSRLHEISNGLQRKQPIGVCTLLYSLDSAKRQKMSGRVMFKKFKSRELELDDKSLEYLERLVAYIKSLEELGLSYKGVSSRNFMTAFAIVTRDKKFDPKLFREKIKQHCPLKGGMTVVDIMATMQKIINWKVAKEERYYPPTDLSPAFISDTKH